METQRCPMCGQANPPHLEICQYCQARLKPLWVEPSEGTSSTVEDGITKSKAPIEPDEPLVPDWLITGRMDMDEGTSSGAEEFGEEEALFSEDTSDTGDLLAGMFSDKPFEEQDEDVPEWLRSLRDDSITEDSTLQSAKFGDQDQPSPFWLDFAENGAEEPPPEPSSSIEKVLPFKEEPFEEIAIDSAVFLPAQEVDEELTSEEPQAASPFESPEPFLFAEQPSPFAEDFTSATEPADVSSKEGEASLPVAEGDWMSEIPPWLETLPGEEWVEGETAEKETPPEFLQGVVPPFVETDEELGEIEFPAWLDQVERSIEPELNTVIESLTPSAVETLPEREEEKGGSRESPDEAFPQEEIAVEIVGPLHGLRGVLPAEPLVAEQKKPSKALSELLVTDKQRAQAELFLRMIEDEGKPKPIPPSKRAKPHLLWRVLIFLALFVAAVVGLVVRPFSTAPQELSVGVFDAMQVVNQLPAAAPVLLVIDMEGSDYAEMQATTNAVLDQMMIKGAFFVVVSANQNGALQADRLLREVSRLNGHKYQPSSGWVNLGYLPGGVAGMQAFSQSLTEVLPNTIDGEPAWQNERLKNIRSLSDFALVMVVTEDSTRARQWIEQLKGRVSESRLVFAVSAQVEPVLRPYYEASPRQVQSVLAGIRDGAIYETQSARPGWAMQLWDAYTLVALVGTVLILMGSLVYALMAMFVRRKLSVEGKTP